MKWMGVCGGELRLGVWARVNAHMILIDMFKSDLIISVLDLV